MAKLQWKKQIKKSIRDKGYDYYWQGHVHNLKEYSKGYFRANVEGTKDYDVEIFVLNGKVESMQCNCPYAAKEPCKHIAAVCYAIEDKDLPNDEFTMMAKRIYDRNFRDYLLDLHEKCEEPFELKASSSCYMEYQKAFNALKRRYGSFISYWQAFEFEREVSAWLNQSIRNLLMMHWYEVLERLLLYVMKKMPTIHMDDDGSVMAIEDQCADGLIAIAALAPTETKECLFQHICQLYKDKDYWASSYAFESVAEAMGRENELMPFKGNKS